MAFHSCTSQSMASMASRISALMPSTSRFLSTMSDSDLQDAPFVHFRTRRGDNPKFKSPRKRASKLFHELNTEMCSTMKEAKPSVFEAPVRVGDAVELEVISQGGVQSTNRKNIEKMRGVVIGMASRGLATSVHIRDVVHGEPVERKIHLFSPLVKSMKVLEENFVYKGKRKVKRAKLYFLRERNPAGEYILKMPTSPYIPLYIHAILTPVFPYHFRIPSYEVVIIMIVIHASCLFLLPESQIQL